MPFRFTKSSWLFHHLFRQASEQNHFRFRPGSCAMGLPHCSQRESVGGTTRLCRRQKDFTVLMDSSNWFAIVPCRAYQKSWYRTNVSLYRLFSCNFIFYIFYVFLHFKIVLLNFICYFLHFLNKAILIS